MEAEMDSPKSSVHSNASASAHGSLGPSSLHHRGGPGATTKQKKHKHGSLPLKMFLSLDEDDKVSPECVNASNPFHKCADYCFQPPPQPEKKHAMDGKRLGGGRGAKMVEARRHVDPNCRYASNPYHSCGPYCYDTITQNYPTHSSPSSLLVQFNEEKQQQGDARNVNPRCKNASNPFHQCADYCFQKGSEIDRANGNKTDRRSDEKGVPTEREVDPNCINASYCLPRIPRKDDHAKAAGSNQALGDEKKREQSSNCKYASNPYHNCAEFCSNSVPAKSEVGRRETSAVREVMEKVNIRSKYINASDPGNREAKDPESEALRKDIQLEETEESSMKSSSPKHKCLEPRVQSFYEDELVEKVGITSGIEGDLEAMEDRNMHLKCIDSFDLSHLCIRHSLQSETEKSQAEQRLREKD